MNENKKLEGSIWSSIYNITKYEDLLEITLDENGYEIPLNNVIVEHEQDGSKSIEIDVELDGVITENGESISGAYFYASEVIELAKMPEVEDPGTDPEPEPEPEPEPTIEPTQPILSTNDIYIGDELSITLNPQTDSLQHIIRYEFVEMYGLIEDLVPGGAYYWDIPNSLNEAIPFKQEGNILIIVETYNNGVLIGSAEANLNAKRSFLPAAFPTPSIDDKIIIFDSFDVHFETPLVILDTVNDVSIKEVLNAEFELNMNVSYNEKSKHIKADNYVQILGDIFKIKKTSRSRTSSGVTLSIECEHVYFELLDDYIRESDRRTFFPHELAAHLNKFTSFNIKVEEKIINAPGKYPRKRVTISRGSPIKTILMMMETWGLDLDRFRRTITVRANMNEDKIQLFKHQKNLTSMQRIDNGGQLTTRLHLIGKEGLSVEGLEITEIPYKTETSNGVTTILSDDDVVYARIKSSAGKLTSSFIDSKYIESYPIPRNGEIVDGYIDTKLELLLKGIEVLNQIDSINNSFTINAEELKKVSGEIERFGLGYKALIQDEYLLSDYEHNLAEARIVEYTYNPFESDKSSVIKAGLKEKGALQFFKDLEELKEVVDRNIRDISEIGSSNGGGDGGGSCDCEDIERRLGDLERCCSRISGLEDRLETVEDIMNISSCVIMNDINSISTQSGWLFKGEDKCVMIPKSIGDPTLDNRAMFSDNGVERVILTHDLIEQMSGMFSGSTSINLDLSNFKTSNVTDMTNMFLNNNAESLDLSNFDTSNVIYMDGMFERSKSESTILSSFNTSNVIDMSRMFLDSKDGSLDLSNFDTSNVDDMNNMFGLYDSDKLDLSNFNTSNVTSMGGMFSNSNILDLDLSNFDTSNVIYMNRMFESFNTITLDLSGFDMSKSMCDEMFRESNIDNLIMPDSEPIELGNVSNLSMENMFYKSTIEMLSIDNFKTPNVVNMRGMFLESNIRELMLTSFNTSNVTDMSRMFEMSNAILIDTTSFDTSNVTDMSAMFERSKIESLYLNNFDTSNVINMDYMFHDSELVTLDLSSFDTSSVNSMEGIFEGLDKLEKLYVSGNFNIVGSYPIPERRGDLILTVYCSTSNIQELRDGYIDRYIRSDASITPRTEEHFNFIFEEFHSVIFK